MTWPSAPSINQVCQGARSRTRKAKEHKIHLVACRDHRAKLHQQDKTDFLPTTVQKPTHRVRGYCVRFIALHLGDQGTTFDFPVSFESSSAPMYRVPASRRFIHEATRMCNCPDCRWPLTGSPSRTSAHKFTRRLSGMPRSYSTASQHLTSTANSAFCMNWPDRDLCFQALAVA